MRRKSVSKEKCVEKVFFVEKCVEKVFFWRNASKKCFSREMRRKSVFLEKCVEKVGFRFFSKKKSEMRRKSVNH